MSIKNTVVEIRRHDGTVQIIDIEKLLKKHKDKIKLHTFKQQEDDLGHNDVCDDCYDDNCSECGFSSSFNKFDEEECQCQTCTCQDSSKEKRVIHGDYDSMLNEVIKEPVKEEYYGCHIEIFDENGEFIESDSYEGPFDKKEIFKFLNNGYLDSGETVKVWKLGKPDLSFSK